MEDCSLNFIERGKSEVSFERMLKASLDPKTEIRGPKSIRKHSLHQVALPSVFHNLSLLEPQF